MADRYCVYFVYSEQLVCYVGANFKSFKSYSGGGRTTAYYGGGDRTLTSFDPRRPTKTKTEGGQKIVLQNGGSIPPGRWTITDLDHRGVGPSLMLEPSHDVSYMFPERFEDGLPFLIHLTGPSGSWGCITLHTNDFCEFVEFALGVSCRKDTFKTNLPSWSGSIPLQVHHEAQRFDGTLDRAARRENIA